MTTTPTTKVRGTASSGAAKSKRSTPKKSVPAKKSAPAKKPAPDLDRVGSPEAKARFVPVREALIGRDGVSERGMFGARSLTRDGKGFVMLYKDQLVVKFSRERVAQHIAQGDGVGWDPGHGRTMKEWLAVPLSSSADWRALAEDAYALLGAVSGEAR